MAVAAYDLCTVAQVKEFLQKSDTGQDDLLQAVLTRASKAILNYTGREFSPTTASAARAFSYEGGGAMSLAPYDLRSVTSIVIDSDTTSPVTLETTDYVLQPKPAKDGVYGWLLLPNHDIEKPYAIFAQREVTVTGAWGFAAIPEDVRHWAIQTTVAWFRKDIAAFSSAYAQDEQAAERPEALPRSVVMGLSHYRRRHVV
jgi:hypothetical protein